MVTYICWWITLFGPLWTFTIISISFYCLVFFTISTFGLFDSSELFNWNMWLLVTFKLAKIVLQRQKASKDIMLYSIINIVHDLMFIWSQEMESFLSLNVYIRIQYTILRTLFHGCFTFNHLLMKATLDYSAFSLSASNLIIFLL